MRWDISVSTQTVSLFTQSSRSYGPPDSRVLSAVVACLLSLLSHLNLGREIYPDFTIKLGSEM